MRFLLVGISCVIEILMLEVSAYNDCVECLPEEDDAYGISNCVFRDFSIPELLRLKKSLAQIAVDRSTCGAMGSCTAGELNSNLTRDRHSDAHQQEEETPKAEASQTPSAMALKAEGRGHPSGDYHPWQPEEKPSKLETLFQISVTALAFLSFGGYLLCLIVQAIKSKGTTYFHPVATTKTNTNNGVKRIKVYRRSRRRTKAFAPLPYEHSNTLEYVHHSYKYPDGTYGHDFAGY